MNKPIVDRARSLIVLAILLLGCLGAAPAAAQNVSSTPRTPAQLEQLVAPIALYPDAQIGRAHV